MPDQALPEPLRTILASVFHANAMSGWKDELLAWEFAQPENRALIRHQLACAGLRGTAPFELFHSMTHHEVSNQEETNAWFRNIFKQYYRVEPKGADCPR
jgi:hypothetical protein